MRPCTIAILAAGATAILSDRHWRLQPSPGSSGIHRHHQAGGDHLQTQLWRPPPGQHRGGHGRRRVRFRLQRRRPDGPLLRDRHLDEERIEQRGARSSREAIEQAVPQQRRRHVHRCHRTGRRRRRRRVQLRLLGRRLRQRRPRGSVRAQLRPQRSCTTTMATGPSPTCPRQSGSTTRVEPVGGLVRLQPRRLSGRFHRQLHSIRRRQVPRLLPGGGLSRAR